MLHYSKQRHVKHYEDQVEKGAAQAETRFP